MIDGVTLRLGGKDYVVPPLNLKAIKKLAPAIEALNKAGSQSDSMPRVAEIALAALQRNYPDITLDEIEDILDMANARKVISAVMGQSGFEVVPAGEAKAVSERPSTGTTSTAS